MTKKKAKRKKAARATKWVAKFDVVVDENPAEVRRFQATALGFVDAAQRLLGLLGAEIVKAEDRLPMLQRSINALERATAAAYAARGALGTQTFAVQNGTTEPVK
jgi:hypothetical protein